MNRSLDELSASELNAAIDDTNFPKSQNNSAVSTPLDAGLVSQALGLGTSSSKDNDQVNGDEANKAATVNGTAKGFINREHPTPLKMVAFREDTFDVPGTPRTPRTSTTPGRLIFFGDIRRIKKKNNLKKKQFFLQKKEFLLQKKEFFLQKKKTIYYTKKKFLIEKLMEYLEHCFCRLHLT